MILLLFSILAVFFILETIDYKYKKELFILILIILTIVEAIKWESGIDFNHSYWHYQEILSPKSRIHYEFLYNKLAYLLASLHIPYSLFLLIIFSGIYTLYYFGIKKFTESPLAALLFIFCITIGLMGSNRQILALAIVFFSTSFFLPSKKIFFFVAITVATLIHQSALFALPFLFFGSKINLKWWGVLFVIAIIFQVGNFTKPIFDYLLLHFGPKIAADRVRWYNQYFPAGEFNYLGFSMGVTRRIVPVVLLYLYREQLAKHIQFQLVFNILLFSILVYILTYSDLDYVSSRVGVYYLIFEAIAYSWLLMVFAPKQRYFIAPIIVFYCAFLLYKNTMFYPELFFPYKTIFGTF